jgi:hypothetical protein
VWCHVTALVRCHMDNDSSAWWGERASVEVKDASDAGVGRKSWLSA